jgi:hypothetical protein
LNDKYRPAPEIEAKDAVFEVHHSFKKTELIPKLEINLSKLKSNEEKDTALNDFIMERAAESKHHYKKFYNITALLRIKEKMLKDIYSEKKFEEEMASSKLRDTSGKSKTVKETVEE